jgi:hypothetical protein
VNTLERFTTAVSAFDRANAADPTKLRVDGVERPRELVHAERLSVWVDRLEPAASEALRLAARCQHLCRWEIPRASYAEGRIGYLEWRKALARFHADRASAILHEAGYDEATIERVRAINQKRGIKIDADVQTMEDALCLSFLEHELEEFAEKHAPEKVVDILQKTWRKMSERGHGHALGLVLSERTKRLVEMALGG